MNTPVEARSLSSLTNLFATPPQYPRNPTHKELPALVLYIVRVPGSKDIFLTPLKPPTKASIGVEAIQSSLYYLHVLSAEDEIARESVEEQRRSRDIERANAAQQIPRKPLPSPSSTDYPAAQWQAQQQAQPPERYLPYQPTHPTTVLDTQAAWHATGNQPVHVHSSGDFGTAPRHPAGPRPLQTRLRSADEGSVQRKPVGNLDGEDVQRSRRWTALPLSTPVGANGEPRQGFQAPNLDPGQSAMLMPSLAMPHQFPLARGQENTEYVDFEKSFHIVLIRRDPASGGQWNIGTIRREASSTSAGEALVKIEISTPGYQKFAKQSDPRSSVDFDLSHADPSTIKKYIASTTSGSPSTPTAGSPTSVAFTRELYLRQPRSPNRTQHSNTSSDTLSYPSPKTSVPSQPNAKTHHYTFTSPWHGECTFSTGMNGRSLKCRHTLPGGNPAIGGLTATVAELRFNLPWSALRSKDVNSTLFRHGKKASISNVLKPETKDSWKKGIQKIKDKSMNRDHDSDDIPVTGPTRVGASRDYAAYESNSDSESDEEGRLDLRLGREKAGGGRKGKNAKLSKLVIEDEGLKMCDLVVASCMGVWWQYYTARMR